jgi:hypothetical protein
VAAGAVGELLPILAIALLLGVSNRFVALISLGVVAVVSVLLSLAPRVVQAGGWPASSRRGSTRPRS